jgi:hypothetical protein
MVTCVIQLVDPLPSIIVFSQLRLGEAIAAFFCEHFDLLLDKLDEFGSKLFPITTRQDMPLFGRSSVVVRWEDLAWGWHQDRKTKLARNVGRFI